MNIEEYVKNITSELDAIFQRYKDEPGFEHPTHPEKSPRKHAWGVERVPGIYMWHMHYEAGDSLDTSGFLLKLYSDKSPFHVIIGKSYEPFYANQKTSEKGRVLDMFERCIVDNIINSRP